MATVGTQLPFDRLIKMLDSIATSIDEPIFAQTGASSYKPQNVEWSASLPAERYNEIFAGARVIVSHAGIGTVLRANREKKPIVLLPRQAKFGEHRDDHQIATCEHLGSIPGVYVVGTEEELIAKLKEQLVPVDLEANSVHRAMLIKGIRNYLAEI